MPAHLRIVPATGTPAAVTDAATRLMTALGLHPDAYPTLLDALADVYDAGGADTATAGTAPLTAVSSADAHGWRDDTPGGAA